MQEMLCPLQKKLKIFGKVRVKCEKNVNNTHILKNILAFFAVLWYNVSVL